MPINTTTTTTIRTSTTWIPHLVWLFLVVHHHVDISSGLATPTQHRTTSTSSSSSSSSRRRWLRDTLAGLVSLVAVNNTIDGSCRTRNDRVANAAVLPPVPVVIVDVAGGGGTAYPKTVNPFVRFDTVSMVPDAYFVEHQSLYGFTERILDGDTIRIRHVPGYGINTFSPPEPLTQRGIANDTLMVRMYAVDCPETAKRKDQISQPFSDAAKTFTTNLLYHQMVKVTLLRRDQYGRAIGMVETIENNNNNKVEYGKNDGSILLLVNANTNENNNNSDNGRMDVSLELARRGLAELYTGGGAEYNGKKAEFLQVIAQAKQDQRGIWSLDDDNYVSAAEYKRRLRSDNNSSSSSSSSSSSNDRRVDQETKQTFASTVTPTAAGVDTLLTQ